MGLESSPTYISDLNSAWPLGTDVKSAGDDHMRNIKSTLLATFPSITGAVTATHGELNLLAGAGTSGAGMLADIGALTDPNADRVLFWDDSAGAVAQLAPDGTNVTISGTTLGLGAALSLTAATFSGTVGANLFSGSGASLTSLNATNLSSGTVADARLSANVPLLDASNTFSKSGANAQRLTTTNATPARVEFATSSSLRGSIGAAGTTSDGVNGTAAGDLFFRAESGTFFFSGDAGTTAHLKLSASGVVTPNANASEVGFKGTPFSGGALKTDNYTCVLSDAGGAIVMSASGKTITIPANASVAYPVGTVLVFGATGVGAVSIAITSDDLRLAGTGSTGTRTLAANGVASALKITSTVWLISGAGLS